MTQGWVDPLNPNIKIQILICYPMCFQYEGTHSSFLKECWFSSKPTSNSIWKVCSWGHRGTQVYQFWSFQGTCQLALTSLVFGSFTSQIIAKEIPQERRLNNKYVPSIILVVNV